MKHHLIKSVLCLVLALAMVLTAAAVLAEGGGSRPSDGGGTSGPSDGGNSGGTAPAATEAPQDDRFEVTEEYRWTEDGKYKYGMVIRNTSGVTGSFLVFLDFLDGAGNKVGSDMMMDDPCDNGAEAFLKASCDSPFERVSYQITYADAMYNDIASYVQITAEKAGNSAVIQATNTGTVDADAVEFDCLFLDDSGKVVWYDWGFLTDADLQLKSGMTEKKIVNCPSPFSTLRVFLSGHTDKSVVNAGTAETGQDAPAGGYEVIRDYYWKSYSFYYYGVAVKNTSGADAGIRVTFTFYDANGGVIAMNTEETGVCANGYAVTLTDARTDEYDHADYTVELLQPKYNSIQADIRLDITQDKYTATIAGTNTAESTVSDVQYEAWFLDENGNVIGRDWNYLNGEGSTSGSIRPGETATQKAYSDPYATVDVYITGYRK